VKALLGFLLEDTDQSNAIKNLVDAIVIAFPSDVITLVLDEANLPFTINEKTSDAKIDQVKETLSLFTSLTKENKKVRNLFLLLFY
jgi:hypothetical protein